MKILFISGLGPDPSVPGSGIFITRRLRELSRFSVDFRSLIPVADHSRVLRLAKKILGQKNISHPPFIISEGVRFDNVPVCMDLKRALAIRLLDPAKREGYFFESIMSFIGNEKFDLVHTHRAFPHGAIGNMVAKSLGIPSVLTAHGSEIHTFPLQNRRYLPPTIKALEEADRVIFVSSSLRDKAVIMGYSGKNAVIIPNGIDTERFRPLDKKKIKEELMIPYKCVGFVGNLIPVKRADRLALIFKGINDLCPGIVFLVVGDGTLRAEMAREGERLGLDVRFTGRVAPGKVPYFMNAMDVMILPSRNEGWPCVVLEAQACGVPVVGSENGGIPEAVGDAGAIVPEGEDLEKRFAEAAADFLNSPVDPAKMIMRARRFAWSGIAGKEIKVYEETLREKGHEK